MNYSSLTTLSASDVFTNAHSTENGLSADEVKKRLAQHGPNALESQEVHWWQVLARQFRSPFLYLLLFAAALALALGELIDGVMIIIFVLIDGVLGFYQEYRSEQTVRLLQKFVVAHARVNRDGQETMVNSNELVPGDVVVVEAGDVIPADIRFTSESDLLVDESVLTGESAPVKKIGTALSQSATEIYEATNIGFSGTTIASGKGIGVVCGTGKNTEIGNIARMAGETKRVSSFEKGLGRFSTFILRLIVLTLVVVFLAHLLINPGEKDISSLIIFAITLAVSVIPEALPVVTTFSLSRGALQLAKNHVVVKRLSAIEDLGSIEVLCTDKTGTITENKMTVANTLAHAEEDVLFYANLGSSIMVEDTQQIANAFDAALWKELNAEEQNTVRAYSLADELPFDPERKRHTVILEKDQKRILVTRGAPESIVTLSKNVSAEQAATVQRWMQDEGLRGRRVLAVGMKSLAKKSTTEDIGAEENNFTFIGLVSFVDPLKSSTKEAIRKAKELGVRVKVITGDSPEVAAAVGFQVGLIPSVKDVITGEEIESLPHAAQVEAVETHAVFARVSPQQKYNIISLLQTHNEVGFLGEGINDAPALKIANVGLVVSNASDVAREAADIVLLQQSLQVIIDGIEQGRKVFANTTKYIKATLSSNFGNFYAVAIASLLIDFLPMLPLQILLLNLLSDFPMIAVVTDSVDAQELKKPHGYNIHEIALLATVLGVVSTSFDFIYFALFYRMSPEILQTNWFIGSILTELLFLFSIRTRLPFLKAARPSRTILWLTGIAAVVTVALPYTAVGQNVFHFAAPTTAHLMLILGIAIVYFIFTESAKLLYYRFLNHNVTANVPWNPNQTNAGKYQ